MCHNSFFEWFMKYFCFHLYNLLDFQPFFLKQNKEKFYLIIVYKMNINTFETQKKD
jgi:hypothetical protein